MLTGTWAYHWPFNPFSTARRSKRHQNKVKVKGLGKNGSYIAGFIIFFFHGSVKKLTQLAKKHYLTFSAPALFLAKRKSFFFRKFIASFVFMLEKYIKRPFF